MEANQDKITTMMTQKKRYIHCVPKDRPSLKVRHPEVLWSTEK
jgi:hypothetical protein